MDDVAGSEKPMSTLVAEIAADFGRMMQKEVALAKAEMAEEYRKLRILLVLVACGGVLLLVGIIFVGLTVVAALREANPDVAFSTLLAAVAGVLVVLGAGCLWAAQRYSSRIRMVPDRAVRTLKEGVPWQTT